MSGTLKWTPNNIKRRVIAELTANAEIAGKFVETDARRRLEAIQEPEWGRGYRREIVSRLLRYEVEALPKELVIRVGVAPGSSGRHHGFYIEMGSSTAPAQPFLRPAVFENGRRIVALLAGK